MRAFLAALTLCVIGASAHAQDGIASLYGGGDGYCGRPVAAGGVLHCDQFTAAHRTLPFNTLVRVTNKANGHAIVVRITDRGPYVAGRVIDLPPAAAHRLGFEGLAHVELEVVNGPLYQPKHGDWGVF